MIQSGSKLRYIAHPEHYLSSEYKVGEVYEVIVIALSGENRIGAFKFKGMSDDWITERFFEEV